MKIELDSSEGGVDYTNTYQVFLCLKSIEQSDSKINESRSGRSGFGLIGHIIGGEFMNHPSLLSILRIIVVVSFLSAPQTAWAVWAPEPESGGKYFRSKGTMSSQDYDYLGRPGTRTSQDYYYGKGMRAGILRIKPQVSYAREFDNNVFLAPSKKQSDWINRLNSGLAVEAPFDNGKYVLFGGFQSQSKWFVHHPEVDYTDWTFQGGGQANFNSFSFNLFEDYRITSDRGGTDFTGFNKRHENYLTGLLEVPMARFFFENEISHYLLEFTDSADELGDRWELREIPRVGMDIGDRTQALIEYAITPIIYLHEKDRNGFSNAPSLGVRGFLGKGDLVSYQAWAGYENRSYDSSSRKDFNGFIGRGDIRYRPSALTELIAEATRRPEESFSTTNSYEVRNDIGLRYRQKMTDYGIFNLGASTGLYDFSGGRDDFFWEAFTKVEVLLPGKFASVFGEYRYAQRHSNQSANDYADNRASFGVKLEM